MSPYSDQIQSVVDNKTHAQLDDNDIFLYYKKATTTT